MIKIGVLIEEKELSEKEKTTALAKACLGDDAPEILYTGEGKPYFCSQNDNKNLQIDVSFSSNSAAVIIADGFSECAIDIQSSARVGLGRLFELFGSKAGADAQTPESEISSDKDTVILVSNQDGIYKANPADIKLSYLSPLLAARDSLAKWTLLESGIKCRATEGIKTKTLLIKYKKNRYAATVAVCD